VDQLVQAGAVALAFVATGVTVHLVLERRRGVAGGSPPRAFTVAVTVLVLAVYLTVALVLVAVRR
jgi:hypothetical protein